MPDLGIIPLTGKPDRLDHQRPNRFFTVIDYKTGEAKDNDLRGLTKAGTGDYYRQLVFYKLLLDADGRYPVGKGQSTSSSPRTRGR